MGKLSNHNSFTSSWAFIDFELISASQLIYRPMYYTFLLMLKTFEFLFHEGAFWIID